MQRVMAEPHRSSEATAAVSRPNFLRPLFCVFGVTLDNVATDEALAIVRKAVRSRTPCVVTTPNLNFVVRSTFDRAFRDSIIRSDLNLADGMPLVWAGRWLGVDVKERVTGAGLFERMRQASDATPLKIYLFGGPPGVAGLASDRLNAEGGGVRCVGYHTPGYGSVTDMSAPEVISGINASGADFLLVALGAVKGQAWIQHNRDALTVPVISHLGAVINFTAGTIARAPAWVQDAGLEWLWRISREPGLSHRYASDALRIAAMLVRMASEAGLAGLSPRRNGSTSPACIRVSETDGDVALALAGRWTAPHLAQVREVFQSLGDNRKRLSMDCTSLTEVDSAAVALLLTLRRFRLDRGLDWRMTGVSFRLRRRLHVYGASDLLG